MPGSAVAVVRDALNAKPPAGAGGASSHRSLISQIALPELAPCVPSARTSAGCRASQGRFPPPLSIRQHSSVVDPNLRNSRRAVKTARFVRSPDRSLGRSSFAHDAPPPNAWQEGTATDQASSRSLAARAPTPQPAPAGAGLVAAARGFSPERSGRRPVPRRRPLLRPPGFARRSLGPARPRPDRSPVPENAALPADGSARPKTDPSLLRATPGPPRHPGRAERSGKRRGAD